MADFHGIVIEEDHSDGHALAYGGAPDPVSGHIFVTSPTVNNRPFFVTTQAPDGSRIRAIVRKAG